MQTLRHIIGLAFALLFVALSAAATPLAPEKAAQIAYSLQRNSCPVGHYQALNTAGAPTSAVLNLAVASGVVLEHRNIVARHRVDVSWDGLKSGGEFLAPNKGIDGVWDQGRFTPIQRGNAIEDHLAGTDYMDWTRVGSQDNGFSLAWDFNQGSTWVSLKTLDTGGSGWHISMRSHIRELETWSSPTNPEAVKVLDIRVQPGGAAYAQSLIDYGASRGVQVRINEF